MIPEAPAHLWHLSSEGMASCVDLAAALRPYEPDRIVTSNQRKAFETGRILAENLYIAVEVHAGLGEHERADVPWLSQTEFRERVRDVLTRRDTIVFGGESAAEALDRFAAAVAELTTRHAGEVLVIVTHGTVMSLYVEHRTGRDALDVWEDLGFPAFAVLDEQGGLVALETEVGA